VNRLLPTLLLLCPFSAALPQQEAAPPQKKAAPANDIFSGNVSALAADSITVERKVLTRDNEMRTFVLDAQTRVEGKLRLKARVTVRYHAYEDGQLRALHIIVR
jgi:hypothetical protein